MNAEKPASDRVFFFYGGLCRKVLVHQALFSGFVIAAALHGIGNGLMAVSAALLGTAFVKDSSHSSSFFGWVGNPETLALVGVLAATAKGAGATVGATLQSRLSQKVTGAARRDLAARLLLGGSTLPSGHLAARLSLGLREVERGVEEGFLGGIRAGLALAPLGLALAVVSTKLAWAAVLLLVPFGGLLSLARTVWKRSYVRAAQVAEGIHGEVDELVAHMDVWRVYGAAESACRTLDGLTEQAARVASRAEGSRAALSSANEVLGALTLLGCVAIARWLAMPLGDGKLVAFAVPFFMAYRPLRDLGDARAALERGAVWLASLEGAARRPRQPASVASVSRRWERAALEVSGLGVVRRTRTGEDDDGSDVPLVRHAPGGDEQCVRTSFVLRPGEIVAVVGPTGSGKTTLLRALLGLEPDAVGSLRYGPEELARAGVGPAARPFAWAPQDAPLLAGTLEDNVLFSAEAGAEAGEQRSRAVEDLLGSLGAERLVRACGGSQLGAAGRPVSGGERKWIALARAIASGLPVLLLDEPTAGLDADAEEAMLAALDRLRATRAIVLVTHQQRVVRRTDRVVTIGSDESGQNWAKNRGSFSKNIRTSGMS